MIGETVSHYRILEHLGGGGMGVVYKAEDEKLERIVALKFLPPELSEEPDARERFLREAKAAAALDHPNICTIHEIGETDEGRLFIAMAFYQGETLKKRISRGPMDVDDAMRYGVQIAEGLRRAHDSGIVHRDVKPANVFITRDDQAKILDFGLAKVVPHQGPTAVGATSAATDDPDLTSPGATLGTVGYMSPEQVQGKDLDPRTDIFSCGVLMYEMVTGHHAFTGRTSAMVFDAILHGTPTAPVRLNPQVDPELEHIINKALEKDRDLRYQSSAELRADLKRLQRDTDSRLSHRVELPVESVAPTVEPTPQPSAPPQVRASRQWLKPAAITGVAIVVAAAAVGLFLGLRDRGPVGIGASGRPAIAVMPFEVVTGSEDARWLGKGVPNMLVTGLAQTEGLDVVSTLRLHEVLRKVAGEAVDSIGPGQVLEVARRAGAGAVVVGSIFGSGSDLRIDARVEDVASGRLVSAHDVRGDEVFDLVDQLTDSIRADLGVAAPRAARGIAEVTSESLEAQRLYSACLEAMSNLRDSEAVGPCRAAVEIDPTYAMAHFQLWQMGQTLGDRRLEEEHRQSVIEHLDRLPDRQRLLVEAVDAWSVDVGKTEALLEELITRFPDSEEGYNQLQILHWFEHQDRERALAVVERGVNALPRSSILRNQLGYALLEVGRYAEAVREFETYVELEPEEPNPLDSLGEAYLVMGQPEKAIEKYSRAVELDDSFYMSLENRAWARAMLGRYDHALVDLSTAADIRSREGVPLPDHLFLRAFLVSRVGRYQEAKEVMSHGFDLADTLQTPSRAVNLELLAMLLAFEERAFHEAPQSTIRVLENIRENLDYYSERGQKWYSVGTHVMAGLAACYAGDRAAAESHLRSALEVYEIWPDDERWYRSCLEGELALDEGNLSGAQEAFMAGEPELKAFFSLSLPAGVIFGNHLPCQDWRARLQIARGDVDGAIEAYRQLLTPDIGDKFTMVLQPRYVLELAKLLEESGDTAAARQEYERFLELWKDADPDLPELAESRTRLAQLD